MSGNKTADAKQSTRHLMGIKDISDYSIQTQHGELVLFIIKPTNISVLSGDSISARIYALMTVLKGMVEIEMLCLNSRENFDDNKRNLKERMEKEVFPYLSRIEKSLKEQGFSVKRAGSEDIKRILAVYFEQYTYFKEKKTNSTLERFANRKATDTATEIKWRLSVAFVYGYIYISPSPFKYSIFIIIPLLFHQFLLIAHCSG